ncbi:hypothetical protein ACI0X9_004206, partial [Cronobacter turicensis]
KKKCKAPLEGAHSPPLFSLENRGGEWAPSSGSCKSLFIKVIFQYLSFQSCLVGLLWACKGLQPHALPHIFAV